jgi:thymidylate synthase
MISHLRLLQELLLKGTPKSDRTGVGTLSKFGHQERHDLAAGHPLLTTKQVPFKANVVELIWTISGDTRLKFLKDHGVRIWDEWVKPGTEVWGEPWTYLERSKEFTTRVERRSIQPEAAEQYINVWMEQNPDKTPQMEDYVEMFDHFRVPTAALLDGELGPVYGQQWRNIVDTRRIDEADYPAYEKRGFKVCGELHPDYHSAENGGRFFIVERKIDQLQNVIDQLQNNPDDRGIIVSAWHVPDLDDMALRPCHTLFQFYTRLRDWKDVLTDIQFDEDPSMGAAFEEFSVGCTPEERQKAVFEFAMQRGIPHRILDCQLYMRSNDAFLGRPFNISQYSLLTMMIAQVVGMLPGELIISNGDLHLYRNHAMQAQVQIQREPMHLPHVRLNPLVTSLFDFTVDDVELLNYESHPAIKAPVAV